MSFPPFARKQTTTIHIHTHTLSLTNTTGKGHNDGACKMGEIEIETAIELEEAYHYYFESLLKRQIRKALVWRS